jgi:hypothetical protein
MPFRKVSGGKYKSPSGRTFTAKQVRLYRAHNGFPKTAKATKRKKSR